MRYTKCNSFMISSLVCLTMTAFVLLIIHCVDSYRHKIWTSKYVPRGTQVFPTAAVCNGIDQGEAPVPMNSSTIKSIPRIQNWCYTFTYDYTSHKNVRLSCKTQPVFVIWENKLKCTVVNLYNSTELAAYSKNLLDKDHETVLYMWFQYKKSPLNTLQIYLFYGTQDVGLIEKLQRTRWQNIGAQLKFNPSLKVASLSINRKLYTTFLYYVKTREWKPYSGKNEKDFILKQQAGYTTNVSKNVIQIGVVISDKDVLVMQETPETTIFSTIMLMGGALGIATNLYRFVCQPIAQRCSGINRFKTKSNKFKKREILNGISEMKRRLEDLESQLRPFTDPLNSGEKQKYTKLTEKCDVMC